MFSMASRHSETFSAEPRGALLSLFVLRSIEERGLMRSAGQIGSAMLERLSETLSPYDQVGEVRGLGFMQGIEFVVDRISKQPNPELRDRIVRNCVFKQRLWVLGAGHSAIRLLPALVTTEEQAMEGVARFERAVADEVGADRRAQVAKAASS
jgi:4-aminobutyrate aminotransferase